MVIWREGSKVRGKPKIEKYAYVFGLLEGNLIWEEGMDELIFILAPEENLKVVGVDTTYLRKSLDGKNAIIHIEFLTDEKLIKLIRLGKCMSLKNEWLENIIRSKEWETGDEII